MCAADTLGHIAQRAGVEPWDGRPARHDVLDHVDAWSLNLVDDAALACSE